MKQFLISALLLAVIPMVLLNPLGREAFIGYYVGALAMWLVFVFVGHAQRARGSVGR
jgi:hypothetical protein